MFYKLKWAGDTCLNIYFDERIDDSINKKVIALKQEIYRLNIDGVISVISTYHSVGLFCDPIRINRHELMRTIDSLIRKTEPVQHKSYDIVEIPVKYDGEDLKRVALHAGISEEEVIKIHCSPLYRVYMLGFTPGFPYLGGMDERIRTPRLDSPRLKVKAGSVGIADNQTGIYSLDSPGGWNIIGHTEIKLYDLEREQPILLKSGQFVKFIPIGFDLEAKHVN